MSTLSPVSQQDGSPSAQGLSVIPHTTQSSNGEDTSAVAQTETWTSSIDAVVNAQAGFDYAQQLPLVTGSQQLDFRDLSLDAGYPDFSSLFIEGLLYPQDERQHSLEEQAQNRIQAGYFQHQDHPGNLLLTDAAPNHHSEVTHLTEEEFAKLRTLICETTVTNIKIPTRYAAERRLRAYFEHFAPHVPLISTHTFSISESPGK